VPLAIIDIRAKAAANPDAQVTPDDINAWVARNGPIPDRACVAMNSGWDAYVTEPKFRNVDEKKVLHFPGCARHTGHPAPATPVLRENHS
jgi:kynurenine formamidase